MPTDEELEKANQKIIEITKELQKELEEIRRQTEQKLSDLNDERN